MYGDDGSPPSSPPMGITRSLKPAAILAPQETERSYSLSDSGKFQDGLIQISSKGLIVAEHSMLGSADGGSAGSCAPASTVTFELGPEDFEPLEVVGHGASSYVRKALHKKSQTVMALKVISVFDQDKRKQLLTEIGMLFNSECPQLVTFHGAFYHEGAISIALEYATGGSLCDLVKLSGGGVEERILSIITEQILLGLKFMHKDRHQVHRDFKPSNLLLDHSGRVYLTDFGVSTTLNSSNAMCATFVGTYLYMSPERFSGEPYSFPSDVWSLGLTLMEVATGAYPWKTSRSYWDIMNNIVNEPPPELPADAPISPEFRSFVSRCLVKDVARRASCLELLDHPFIRSHCAAHSASDKMAEIAQWVGTIRSVFICMKDVHDAPYVGKEFVYLYHSLFSSRRFLLSSLYTPESTLELSAGCLPGQTTPLTFVGRDEIMPRLLAIELLLHPEAPPDWKDNAKLQSPPPPPDTTPIEPAIVSVRTNGLVGLDRSLCFEETFTLVEVKGRQCFTVQKQTLALSPNSGAVSPSGPLSPADGLNAAIVNVQGLATPGSPPPSVP
mmetsp:Transcript_35719/g.81486  ORF Transcript_35719/g.81486 Transcript_35719/m.81486 type:complete len:557 (-) Transcript_35719:523-2193(-)